MSRKHWQKSDEKKCTIKYLFKDAGANESTPSSSFWGFLIRVPVTLINMPADNFSAFYLAGTKGLWHWITPPHLSSQPPQPPHHPFFVLYLALCFHMNTPSQCACFNYREMICIKLLKKGSYMKDTILTWCILISHYPYSMCKAHAFYILQRMCAREHAINAVHFFYKFYKICRAMYIFFLRIFSLWDCDTDSDLCLENGSEAFVFCMLFIGICHPSVSALGHC